MVDEKTKATGKVKIISKREMPHYVSPGVVETLVEITYRTVDGYEGRISIPKKELTEARVREEIKKALAPIEKEIPEEITL
ncbi:unnamed protein product [marine sediment metagenome]|uniref:Uncharacterized protein n=1 Tax=marine sediment metagenome TaxID=412755 RepID=X1RX05_9ZZZZ